MPILLAILVAFTFALASPADAARRGAKNSAACKSFHSDMKHRGGGYLPPGVTCKKKRRG